MTLIIPLFPDTPLSLDTGDVIAIDLSGYDDESLISLAFPDFPASSLDLTECRVDFTSEEDGNFAVGPTVSVYFDEAITPLTDGDVAFEFTLATLAAKTPTLDLTNVTGVRFRIEATVACTFRCASIRLLDPDWVYPPVDFSTIREYASLPVSKTGTVGAAFDFPEANPAESPTVDWPLLVRTDVPSGTSDPSPINAEIYAGFNTGSMYAASGDLNQAYDFDGSTNYLQITDDASLNPTAEITLEAWVNPDTTSGTHPIIAKNGQYILQINADVVEFTVVIAASNETLTTVDTIPVDEWSHIVAVYDGANQYIYINGVESISVAQTGAIDTSASQLRIGHQASTSNYFDGTIDEAAVYGDAFPQERIEEHYQIALGAPGAYKELVLEGASVTIGDEPVGYWRMASPYDSSAEGNDATLNGTFATVAGVLSDDVSNQISIYLREVAVDTNTQLDLDGDTMDTLDGTDPSYGTPAFISRTQKDIDFAIDTIIGSSAEESGYGLTQGGLDGITQFNLERLQDFEAATFIEIRLTWDAIGANVSVYDAETVGAFYSFDIPTDTSTNENFDQTLYAQNNYALVVRLIENQIRIQIYTMDLGKITSTVFDSTNINDPNAIIRNRGRVGWYAHFADGDALIDFYRPGHLNFGEYRSNVFQSKTPVEGARITASGNVSPKDLFQGIFSGPWGGFFEDNPERSPESFKIRNPAVLPFQGIQTNSFFFDDFRQWDLSFQLFVSAEALEAGKMHAFLWNGKQPIIIPIGDIIGNTWHTVRTNIADIAAEDFIPGEYRLVIVQSSYGTPNDWYVDKISVKRNTMEWSARAYFQDAWNDMDDWVRFRGNFNDRDYGVLFNERARGIQVRGQAVRQNAQVGEIRTQPKYAELGKFVWADEDVSASNTPPVASFTDANTARTYTFTSTSTDSDGWIAQYYWTFGDGYDAVGQEVVHTFEEAGTYPVTLTVMDNNGERDSDTQDIVVT